MNTLFVILIIASAIGVLYVAYSIGFIRGFKKADRSNFEPCSECDGRGSVSGLDYEDWFCMKCGGEGLTRKMAGTP